MAAAAAAAAKGIPGPAAAGVSDFEDVTPRKEKPTIPKAASPPSDGPAIAPGALPPAAAPASKAAGQAAESAPPPPPPVTQPVTFNLAAMQAVDGAGVGAPMGPGDHIAAASQGDNAPRPEVRAAPPSALQVPLHLIVHGIEGSLNVSMAAPFVRMHLVDADTGLWRLKADPTSGRLSIFNVDPATGAPFLRHTPKRKGPWQADVSRSPHIKPFATMPCAAAPRVFKSAVPSATGAGAADGIALVSTPPVWEEGFMVAEPLGAGALLLFEVMDAPESKPLPGTAAAKTKGTEPAAPGDAGTAAATEAHYESLGWAFLNLEKVFAAPPSGPGRRSRHRHMRLQLYRYSRQRRGGQRRSRGFRSGWRGWRGCEEEEEEADGTLRSRPDVFTEYLGSPAPSRRPALPPADDAAGEAGGDGEAEKVRGRGSRGRRALAALAGCARRLADSGKPPWPSRPRWPAALEVSLEPANSKHDLGSAALPPDPQEGVLNDSRLATSAEPSTILPVSEITGTESKVEVTAANITEVVEEPPSLQSALPSHVMRYGNEPSALPDNLLWQITAGERGASRMALSPNGQLLAVAAVRDGGSCELRVFNIVTGSVHAICAAAHDSLVYDLCWHIFPRPQHLDVSFGTAVTTPRALAAAHPLLISCGGDCSVQVFEVPDDPRLVPSGVLKAHYRVLLPSHAYSVCPLTTLSADPRELYLACGGNTFGVMVCKLSRDWQRLNPDSNAWEPCESHDDRPGQRRWSVVSVQQEPAVFDVGQNAPMLQRPDMLCVRFSSQPTAPWDNLYASSAAGRLLLFQVRRNTSVAMGVRVNYVRSYSAPELRDIAIYSFEIVTANLLQGGRLNKVLLSTADDWVLLHARDNTMRLATLQRGILRIDSIFTGHQCGRYPLRGALSPDGNYILCGSETGVLMGWNVSTGKLLPPGSLPQVQLSGPIMDVVWSDHHHLAACCALNDHAPPVLVFGGGDPTREMKEPAPDSLPAPAQEQRPLITASGGYVAAAVPETAPMPAAPPATSAVPKTPPRPRELSPAKPIDPPVPLLPLTPQKSASRISGDLSTTAPVSAITPAMSAQDWAAKWLNTDENPHSAISFDEKRAMKERILKRLLERKGMAEMEHHFTGGAALPGGV